MHVPLDTYLGRVPDNRQSSKQRRAARNRAAREALAARRENALAARSTTDDAATFSGAGAAADPTGGGAGSTRTGRSRGRRPGDLAVLLALVFAGISAVTMLFLRVPVDDRGEPLPDRFRGVAVQAREMLTGRDVGDETTSLLDAQGPGILVVLALPVLVCAFALWANRRPDRSRMLTFAMLALAGTIILGAGFLFLPSLIALAVASFLVRKAELPARMAGRTGPARNGRDGRHREVRDDGRVIDLESEEVAPDDRWSDDGPGSTPGR